MSELHDQVLTTISANGKRIWLKPRLAKGRYWLRRAVVAYGLMALFFVLPWIKINNKPAVLLDVVHRKFTILGYTFLPTDTILLALFMLTVFVSIFFFTAVFGRLWCGWACPQTVYMEYLYRPLERIFDATLGRGGPPRKGLGEWRKPAYFVVALIATSIPAHTFLAYFVGVEQLSKWITQSPANHPAAFIIVLATTFLMMFDFYFFREQLCILACPYGRFQSVLLDPWSLIVNYDRKRGEPRGKKKADTETRGHQDAVTGDCIDCHLCVAVCPTGIDIRNGLQMECVNCTQCIDACDGVMDKIGKPRGLIRYGSQAAMERGEKKLLRPRVIFYPVILLILITALTLVMINKGSADVTFTRTPGNPYSHLQSGEISNSLRIKMTNRTDEEQKYTFAIVGTDKARLLIDENPMAVAPGAARQEPVAVATDPELFNERGIYDMTIHISDGKTFSRDTKVRLLGPAR